MIIFQIGYRPNGFDRPVTKAFKDGIRRKLESAGITALLVTIKRDSHRRLFLDFEGVREEVTVAKIALAGYCACNEALPGSPLFSARESAKKEPGTALAERRCPTMFPPEQRHDYPPPRQGQA